MDRRQRKSREAIFHAFSQLLQEQRPEKITVGQIIDRADVGRATFYAHFETREALLEALCQELFCHLFDALHHNPQHRHIFDCQPPEDGFLHLLIHLQRNDHQLLALLRGQSREAVWPYFQKGLEALARDQLPRLGLDPRLPEALRVQLVCATFGCVLHWWLAEGLQTPPEEVNRYFYLALDGQKG